MTHDELVEAVARAIQAKSPTAGRGDGHLRTQELRIEVCRDLAETAFSVILDALAKPDEAMRMAGSVQMNSHKILRTSFKAGAPDIWSAMLSASPLAKGTQE